MQIVVTGASGRIGRYVVKELVNAGHNVTGIDILASEERMSRFLRVDLTDAGEVYQALAATEAEAVVHLGAWANAGVVPDTRTYGDNVQGTFNLFQACVDLGIQRVISASSAQVYGFAKAPPVYVPVDEAHPFTSRQLLRAFKGGRRAGCRLLRRAFWADDSFLPVDGDSDAKRNWTRKLVSWYRIRARGHLCYGHARTLVMLQLRVGWRLRQNRWLRGLTILLGRGLCCRNRLRRWWNAILGMRRRFRMRCQVIFLL